MSDATKAVDFGATFLVHLDAAHNLARWLMRDENDAQDVVQEAYLRALKFAGGFRGGDARAWILAIVRNTAFTWMKRNREHAAEFDESIHSLEVESIDLESQALRRADDAMLTSAMEQLPAEFREAIVLRDIEGLSYKEIATVADVPIGTVMSRLARARARLARSLKDRLGQEPA